MGEYLTSVDYAESERETNDCKKVGESIPARRVRPEVPVQLQRSAQLIHVALTITRPHISVSCKPRLQGSGPSAVGSAARRLLGGTISRQRKYHGRASISRDQNHRTTLAPGATEMLLQQFEPFSCDSTAECSLAALRRP